MVRRRWQRFPFPDAGRLPRTRSWAISRSTLAGVMVAASLVPLAVALARPQEVLSRRLERAEGVDLVIGLDVSGSMAALDFQPSDRLGVAKDVIGSFIAQRVNDRIGLVVFAGAAVTMCPLTLDHDVVQHLLDQVALETLPDGTRSARLGPASAGCGARRPRQVVVLVTDGSNNTGQLDR
jgi:Ca-activated chloride channel family protein